MQLAHALRVPRSSHQTISFVGAGGKTTALFQLAGELLHEPHSTVIVTSTTHFGKWQIASADHHIMAKNLSELQASYKDESGGVLLITGEIKEDRTNPIDDSSLKWLHDKAKERNIPLLIEADGSRQHALKAPAEHEPPIPEFTNMVTVVAGLGVLGRPLTNEHVHRAEIFSKLGQLALHEKISPESIINVMTNTQGGLKNIPPSAQRIALLNQADTPGLQSIGGSMAYKLLDSFDSVIVGSLQQNNLQVIEHTAGIILAAGESTRYGSPKQLLDWHGKPFVRQVAETALQAGLWPVHIVTGFHHAEIESCLNELPIKVIRNNEYKQGQSTSIKAGINSLPKNIGSAVFLLADQPQILVEVIRALIEKHSRELPPILAPLVLEERRANPVLFDKVTFPDLLQLSGDIGGRGIFDKHRVDYLPWHDDILLFDVDKPEDYERLKDLE